MSEERKSMAKTEKDVIIPVPPHLYEMDSAYFELRDPIWQQPVAKLQWRSIQTRMSKLPTIEEIENEMSLLDLVVAEEEGDGNE